MADFINRDLALEAIKKLSRNVDFDNEAEERGWNNAIDLAYAAVVGIPIADVRPERHGNWIPAANTWTHDLNEASRRIFRCSVCGRYENTKEPFCNCGAMMDGKEKTDDS